MSPVVPSRAFFWRGEGGWQGARVSEFFYKESKSKKNYFLLLGAVISTDREENFRPIPIWLDTLLFASCSYSGCAKTQRKNSDQTALV